MKKLYKVFGVFMGISCLGFSSSIPERNPTRVLLTRLRGGDYAHAGDRDAVDFVVKRALALCPGIEQGSCLDIGSGFGGTGERIRELGFSSVSGFDVDVASVEYARKRYPEVMFTAADVRNLVRVFPPNFFSFLCAFNVLYAVEEKSSAIRELFALAKPGACLAIFDYTTTRESGDCFDFSGKPMYPIRLETFKEDLLSAGWEIIEIIDMADRFVDWYALCLEKAALLRNSDPECGSSLELSRIEATFTELRNRIVRGEWGASLFYARKPGSYR